MYDPIGPGTRAWHQFDKAIEDWQRGNKKAYANHRQYLIHLLKVVGCDESEIDGIKRDLKRLRNDPDYANN